MGSTMRWWNTKYLPPVFEISSASTVTPLLTIGHIAPVAIGSATAPTVPRAGRTARIVAPDRWHKLRNADVSYEMPDCGGIYSFPGVSPKLDLLTDPSAGFVRKYFFETPSVNAAAGLWLRYDDLGLGIHVLSDPRVAPRYGVWCNAGGLFAHANIAIEPASAPLDSLSAAHRLNRLPVLESGRTLSWWLEVSVTSLG